MSYFEFQVSRTSGTLSRTPRSTISRLDPWRTVCSWHTFSRSSKPCRCHILNFKSLGQQELCQEHPYPPSPGWIVGGQDVLDTHSVGRVSPPAGIMFQISHLKDIRNSKYVKNSLNFNNADLLTYLLTYWLTKQNPEMLSHLKICRHWWIKIFGQIDERRSSSVCDWQTGL